MLCHLNIVINDGREDEKGSTPYILQGIIPVLVLRNLEKP
jgi:hypothetical protein